MAKEDMEVGFTLGDQERMVRMEDVLGGLDTKLDNLPCQTGPPTHCAQGLRITSLEDSRKKTVGAIITVAIGTFLAGVAAIFGK